MSLELLLTFISFPSTQVYFEEDESSDNGDVEDSLPEDSIAKGHGVLLVNNPKNIKIEIFSANIVEVNGRKLVVCTAPCADCIHISCVLVFWPLIHLHHFVVCKQLACVHELCCCLVCRLILTLCLDWCTIYKLVFIYTVEPP